MYLTIDRNPKQFITTRRRVYSENICSTCPIETCPISESQTVVQECHNTNENYKLYQNISNKFVITSCEELNCNSVVECVSKPIDIGSVKSCISGDYNINRNSKTFSFNGNQLKSTCSVNLAPKPVECDKEFGYIVTSNKFLKTYYGTQSFTIEYISKIIENRKEVLIGEDESFPFYSNKSVVSLSAGTLPPHNFELEMNYSPTIHLECVKESKKIEEVNFNENLFIYLTMRMRKNGNWEYFLADVVQFYSAMFYNEKNDENSLRNCHKCGLVSQDSKHEFPSYVLRYPNQQNGEFVVSKDSQNGKMCIESFPKDLMGLTEEQFCNKCQALSKI